jgi:predicted porin
MKKSLIALAALATVGAVQAQSSVTVYGTYDLGYQALNLDNVAGSTAAAAQIKSAGIAGSALTSNRFGLRGTEDLGGGLRANFNLEYGFANNLVGDAVTTTEPASGTASITASTTGGASGGTGGALTTRTSRVGLESAKLGRFDIGYGLTGLFATITGHSPLPGNNFIGDVAYTNNTTLTAADSRILLNAVRATGLQYTSPTVNGLQAVVDYGSGSQKRSVDAAGADSRVSNAGLTLRYTAGKLAIAATSHTLKYDYAADSNTINTTDYQAVSARYAVNSQLAVNALYAKNKTKNQAGTQSSKNDVTQVGVAYTMGKTSLVAQYGEGEGETAPNTELRDRKGYQLGAIYNLSKRTNLYAIYGSQEGKFVSSATAASVGVKEKIDGYTVGLRHSF